MVGNASVSVLDSKPYKSTVIRDFLTKAGPFTVEVGARTASISLTTFMAVATALADEARTPILYEGKEYPIPMVGGEASSARVSP